jgi:hypothetical protein
VPPPPFGPAGRCCHPRDASASRPLTHADALLPPPPPPPPPPLCVRACNRLGAVTTGAYPELLIDQSRRDRPAPATPAAAAARAAAQAAQVADGATTVGGATAPAVAAAGFAGPCAAHFRHFCEPDTYDGSLEVSQSASQLVRAGGSSLVPATSVCPPARGLAPPAPPATTVTSWPPMFMLCSWRVVVAAGGVMLSVSLSVCLSVVAAATTPMSE